MSQIGVAADRRDRLVYWADQQIEVIRDACGAASLRGPRETVPPRHLLAMVRRLVRLARLLGADGYLEDAGRYLRQAFEVSHAAFDSEDELTVYFDRIPAFERGWSAAPAFRAPNGPPLQRWRRWCGQPTKRLMVRSTAGLGDEIMLARWLPCLPSERLLVATSKELVPLVGHMLGWPHQAAPRTSVSVDAPGYEVVYTQELPMVFDHFWATIPPAPYIFSDPVQQNLWSGLLRPYRSTFKVGIVWAAGGAAIDRGPERSIGLAALAPLAVPGVQLFSFQRTVGQWRRAGERPAENEATPASMNLVRLGERLTDFNATAAAMSQMDLVITVDTACAHLAGALGIPVWMLLDATPDPRWSIGKPPAADRTVWYSSMRVFKQQRPGDWQPVVAAVRSEILRLAGARRAAA